MHALRLSVPAPVSRPARAWAAPLLLGGATLLGGCSDDIAVLDAADESAGASSGGAGAAGGGAGATGGSGAATSSGPASGGGGSGGLPQASTLDMPGPPVKVVPPNAGDQSRPRLTRSSDDGVEASVVFQHLSTASLDEVAYVSFAPWSAWPTADVGPSAHAADGLESSFVASPSPGNSFNLHHAASAELIPHAAFVPRVTESAAAADYAEALVASFVTSNGFRHLLGVEYATGGTATLRAGPATSNSGGAVDAGTPIALGCASAGPLPSDAEPSGVGWLVAFANGTSPGCLDPELGGPPHHIDVVRLLDDGTLTPGASLDQGAPIAGLATAARADGAWVVWQRASGGQIAPIQAVRVDAAGAVVLGPIDVIGSAREPVRFAVDAVGDRLAIAWEFAGLNARAPGLTTSVVDDEGNIVAERSLDGPILTGPPSVLGSVDGTSILVAYGVLDDHPEVAVVRFDIPAGQ